MADGWGRSANEGVGLADSEGHFDCQRACWKPTKRDAHATGAVTHWGSRRLTDASSFRRANTIVTAWRQGQLAQDECKNRKPAMCANVWAEPFRAFAFLTISDSAPEVLFPGARIVVYFPREMTCLVQEVLSERKSIFQSC